MLGGGGLSRLATTTGVQMWNGGRSTVSHGGERWIWRRTGNRMGNYDYLLLGSGYLGQAASAAEWTDVLGAFLDGRFPVRLS